MKTILLSGHNNFGNRGCEALVRTTASLLREHLGEVRILVPSLDPAADGRQWPQASAHGVEYVAATVPPGAWTKWERLCRVLPAATRLPLFRPRPTAAVRRLVERCDALLVIGGDNYSLDYDLSSLFHYVGEAELALSMGKTVALWGASVGPFNRLPAVERRLQAHLQRLHLVSVRESESLRYLATLGLERNVVSVTDSAFLLSPQAEGCPLVARHDGRPLLGLNLSPLIERQWTRAGRPRSLCAEAAEFVRHAIDREAMDVVLIPHVAPLDGSGGGDERVHRDVVAELGDSARAVTLAPSGLNAAQTKHLIAQCDYFIGARTHATIAAMSCGVPVGSIGYSVKARGLNLDLFGHERYVLPAERVSASSLGDLLAALRADRPELGARLTDVLPMWKNRAHAGALELASLLGVREARR